MGIKKIQVSKLVYILIVAVIFSSCGIQKRLYTKGFYSHKTKTVKKPEAGSIDSLPRLATAKIKEKKSELITANSKFIMPVSTFIDACDTIVLKSGAKLTVSIKDASSTEIKYRTCTTSNGLYLTLKKTDVSRIHYCNGRKEVFEEEHLYNQPSNLPEDKFSQYNTGSSRQYRNESTGKKTNIFSIMGFISAFIPLQVGLIFAFLNLAEVISLNGGGVAAVSSVWFILPLLFAFISFILCLTAIIQIAKNKDSQKGLGMAVFGLILSLIVMIVLLALITSA